MEKVIMPKSLTAENGAKAALIGEFKESVIVTCANCGGCGEDPDDYYETCEDCGGAGSYSISVPVRWTTIKEIYQKAVELFGEEYTLHEVSDSVKAAYFEGWRDGSETGDSDSPGWNATEDWIGSEARERIKIIGNKGSENDDKKTN